MAGLISALDYGHPDQPTSSHRAALLRAAAKFNRLFQLRSATAPGLFFFGGEVDPARIGWTGTGHSTGSVSGTGLSAQQAFESCAGEGIEFLSQFDTADDELTTGSIGGCLLDDASRDFLSALARHCDVSPAQDLAFVAAQRLSDARPVHLPADMCLRRSADVRDFVPPFNLSTGCGAGRSFDEAVLHGLLELIERDAVSLWWRGGRRGRAIAPDSAAGGEAADLLARLRREQIGRTSWLLDITTDIGVPCAVAMSCAPSGRGLACGHAARGTMAAAVRSAIFEMCQMELGHAVAEAKRQEGGDRALNDGDLIHIRRATLIDAYACALLHPGGAACAPTDCAAEEPAGTLRMLLDRLRCLNIETYVVDLTRPIFGVPVARVVAPRLQLDPSTIITKRLASIVAETGGGHAYSGGVALL